MLHLQDKSADYDVVLLRFAVDIVVESQLSLGGVDGVAKQTLQSLHLWCAQQYTLCLVAAGQTEQANHFLKKVCALFSFQSASKMICFLNRYNWLQVFFGRPVYIQQG